MIVPAAFVVISKQCPPGRYYTANILKTELKTLYILFKNKEGA